ncbi:MAG: hypothetical protein K8F62_14730 [Pseudorhodoplanes sp.]|nr:hypothetical protein [Pseudorhodoplanes sp.]
MSKTLIQAIAIGAMLLSPSLASARIGGVSISPQIGNVGTVRVTTVPPRTPPRIRSKLQLLDCHTYERRNPYNDTVVTRTICK